VATSVEQAVNSYFNDKSRIRVVNNTRETSEFIFEVSESVMDAGTNKNGKPISEVLFAVEGVETVNMICQNDEISR